MRTLIIAIDGPAGSGKSSTAKAVAERLGYCYVNTGFMYRAIGLAFMDSGMDSADLDADWVKSISLEVEYNSEGEMQVRLGGRDVTEDLMTRDVGEAASVVSAADDVRHAAVALQKEIIRNRKTGVILEGRDIGTVVAPEADVKVFMDASPEERAKRRRKQLQEKGVRVDLADLTREIAERDERDKTRQHSPLRIAEDAIVVDTTKMSIEEQVDLIVSLVDNHSR